MGGGQSKPSIQQLLSEFSDSLVPSPEFYRSGNEKADKIFKILQKHRKDVGRCLVGGGIGKRTAISETDDFDLYVFLNYQDPPFNRVLQEMKEILLEKLPYSSSCQIINQTTLRLMMDGIQFDISVATNFAGVFSDQRKSTIGRIKELYDNRSKIKGNISYTHYGPALAEYSVAFMKKQTPFAHQVIRLAKYWNKNIIITRYVAGRSLMIELVALHAVREVQKNDIYLVAVKFLELMSDFGSLCVFFTENYTNSGFLWRNDIPKEIYEQRPLILDPANPYNNLANGLTGLFENEAGRSLSKLQEYQQQLRGNSPYTPQSAASFGNEIFSNDFSVYCAGGYSYDEIDSD